MMNSSSVRSVESLDMHRKIAGIVMACLQTSEEEVVVEEEVVGHIEDVEVVANIRTTPHQSLKVHHLNLNLNHNRSPLSRSHSSPNHSKQIQPRNQILQSLEAY
jgi:hypothetical protein